ncbi:MAG: 4Fe-4S binding protein [Lachnospiraceae bacterium]|nr:4Fe-4S binding protein [Lachnospiraceae bacterium]
MKVFNKNGVDMDALIADASEHENARLILNLSCDDPENCLSSLIVGKYGSELKEAFKSLSEKIKAEELILLKPASIDFEIEGAKVIEHDPNPVLREESAVGRLLERGELRSEPLYKEFTSQGMDGRAEVITDAETLLRLAGLNTEVKLICLNEAGKCSLMVCPIDSFAELGEAKGYLFGGVSGKFMASKEFRIEYSYLSDSITLYTEKCCMVSEAARTLTRAKELSCAKCVLCREGSWHLSEIFNDISLGKGKKEDLDMVNDIGPLINIGAFCSFGQNMALTAVSAVEAFRDEFEEHIVRKKCSAGVCAAFSKKSYCIDPTLCTGCGGCEDECDEMAIEGKKKFIYMIDPDMCSACGKCVEACDEDAIVLNDGSIKLPKKLTRVGRF